MTARFGERSILFLYFSVDEITRDTAPMYQVIRYRKSTTYKLAPRIAHAIALFSLCVPALSFRHYNYFSFASILFMHCAVVSGAVSEQLHTKAGFYGLR